MNYTELTPGRRDGYYGSMYPESSQNGGAPTGERIDSVKPGEGDNAPPSANTDPLKDFKEALKSQERLTSNSLLQTANAVAGTPRIGEVLIHAEFVSAAARVLLANIEKDTKNQKAQEIGTELTADNGLKNRIERIENAIKNMGPTTKNISPELRNQTILAHRNDIAQLAKQLSKYYEEAKISEEYDDPFKQIVSFEELMTKFDLTNTDPEFKSGGEFPLLEITDRYIDDFGRTMTVEKAHADNFLRWIEKKIEYYHDFDPMNNIDLFQGMYIVAGSRKISMYEILVDFSAYFAHRQPQEGELRVQLQDIETAHTQGKYRKLEDITHELTNTTDPKNRAELEEEIKDLQDHFALGYYKNFFIPDPTDSSKKKEVRAYVSAVEETDPTLRIGGLHRVTYDKSKPIYDLDEKGNIQFDTNGRPKYKIRADGKVMEEPVEAAVIARFQSKDQWKAVESPENEIVKENIMYEVWLMMRNHNADVAYRQKAMPSEEPLAKEMAELYADNVWTRTRDRLLRLWKTASTTKREDEKGNIYSEAELEMKGLKGEWSLGKARRRAMAFLYHISEANGPYTGYGGLEKMNPAKEMLKKNGIDHSKTFYKSLIRQSLEKNMDYGTYDSDMDFEEKQKCNIAVELVGFLNKEWVPSKRGDGSLRKRFDWEKVDIMDLMLMDNASFHGELKKLHITDEQFAGIVNKLKEKYAGDETKRSQLTFLLTADVGQKKVALNNLVKEKLGGPNAMDDNDRKATMKFLQDAQGGSSEAFSGLDAYAISVFVRCFNKEYVPGINPFENIRYTLEARDRMRQALRDTLVRTEELDAFEAKYAEEWAYTMAYHTGISARNDMGGIGHDAWSKILNTEYYRLRQSGGGNYLGNLESLYGLHRLGVDFWQGMKVKIDGHSKYDKTLYEMLTGLEATASAVKDADGTTKYLSGRFNMDKDVESFEFVGNAMRQFVGDHLGHAVDLFVDITKKHEFNIDKLVTKDNFGRLIINNEEMQKMIDSTWKHLRYGFDNAGFLYDNLQYGWSYTENLNADGSVKRNPYFGFSKMKELMFSKELRELNMYNRQDVSSWQKPDGKMGRNVFAYLIAAQIAEHTKYAGHKRIYSADEVVMIMTAFKEHAARVLQGQPGEAIPLSGFFNSEEEYRILAMAHALIWMLYVKDYGVSMSGGLLFGLFEALALVIKELGESVSLRS